MNKRYFLVLIVLAAISIYTASYISALAVDYKLSVPIPGETGTIQEPPQYILMLFRFSLAIAGLLALGMIIFGAIQYTTSAGNVARQQDAKDRITSAIYGIILLVGATLILTTINPDLALLKWEKHASITSEQLSPESIRWQGLWRQQLNNLSQRASEARKEAERLRKERERALTAGNKIEAQELLVKKLEQDLIEVVATRNRLMGEMIGVIRKVIDNSALNTPDKNLIIERSNEWAKGQQGTLLQVIPSNPNGMFILIGDRKIYLVPGYETVKTLGQQQDLLIADMTGIRLNLENRIIAEKKTLENLKKEAEQSKQPSQQQQQQQIKEF